MQITVFSPNMAIHIPENSEYGHFLPSADEQVLKHFSMFHNSVIVTKSDLFH